MKSMRFVAALAVSTILIQPALAKPAVYPVPTGAETAHFFQGVPTLHLETDTGGVEITALPFDHGHVVFGVAVYNKTAQPANFGIENVAAEIQGAPIVVLSEQELEKRAKSRAAWSQVGMIMLAGAAAAAVANAHTTDHNYGHFRTPHGTYAWSSSYRGQQPWRSRGDRSSRSRHGRRHRRAEPAGLHTPELEQRNRADHDG